MGITMSQPALQVKVGDHWEYVFCHSMNGPKPIVTTPTRAKALPGRDLHWWEMNFGNNEFRVEWKGPGYEGKGLKKGEVLQPHGDLQGINCGVCGEHFPDLWRHGEHMREKHNMEVTYRGRLKDRVVWVPKKAQAAPRLSR